MTGRKGSSHQTGRGKKLKWLYVPYVGPKERRGFFSVRGVGAKTRTKIRMRGLREGGSGGCPLP